MCTDTPKASVRPGVIVRARLDDDDVGASSGSQMRQASCRTQVRFDCLGIMLLCVVLGHEDQRTIGPLGIDLARICLGTSS